MGLRRQREDEATVGARHDPLEAIDAGAVLAVHDALHLLDRAGHRTARPDAEAAAAVRVEETAVGREREAESFRGVGAPVDARVPDKAVARIQREGDDAAGAEPVAAVEEAAVGAERERFWREGAEAHPIVEAVSDALDDGEVARVIAPEDDDGVAIPGAVVALQGVGDAPSGRMTNVPGLGKSTRSPASRTTYG